MHLRLTTWLLVLLTLLLKVQADQPLAEDCRVYCLKCRNDTNSYKTPNVTMGGALKVSLQVAANGTLYRSHIIVHGADSSTSVSIAVNQENVTLEGDKEQLLTLTNPHPAFPWITLVLAPAGPDTLHVYTPPKNRTNVIKINTTHGSGSHVFVSSASEICVVFNCLLATIPDTGNNTEGATASTPTTSGSGEATEAGGDESNKSNQTTAAGGTEDKQKDKEEGSAGAGQVTTWVMAGLALFLVIVLACAFCTKTARASHAQHVQDSQPSVGIIYCKGAAREPEEDSEPESPHELKVPDYRNSYQHRVKDYKVVED